MGDPDDNSAHWCDSIAFELIGTDSFHYRDTNSRASPTLQELRTNAKNCGFCADLARLIDYRSRQDVTWADSYRSPRSNGERAKPTEEDLKNVKVHISIHGGKEARNWSFGFEGTSHRTVMDARVLIGDSFNFQFDILIQRAGSGGRVPVTHKSEVEYGDDTITYNPPGGWRVKSGDDDGPRPATKIASLETALGRPRPLEVNYTMLRGWLDSCHVNHEICQHEDDETHVPRLRLVDTKNMCITETDSQENLQFATLSYVWGTEPFLRLVKDNLETMLTPGSLRDAKLPLTISDALEICRNLQIQYIWIDSLCIIQDDESDMIETIDSMDSIYRRSTLTIVAAASVNAHAGIPGVRQGTRSLEQHRLEIRGIPLIDSVDHRQLRMQTSFQEPEWISATPWAQRAWTFQEALVSRRILFFTAELVYWSCRKGLLSEDTVEHFAAQDKQVLFDDEFDPLEYQHIATTFSRRRLTYESDLGRAYLGTQNYLDKKWGGQMFSWGLPHGSFGSFLMWEWGFNISRRQRQGTHPIKEQNGEIVRVSFPTWSWMGWMEGGQLIHFYGDEPEAHSPLFYTFNGDSELIEIQDGQHWRSQPKLISNLLLGESSGSDEVPQNRDVKVTEAHMSPELHLNPSLKHSTLMFYTQTATVRYDPSAALETRSPLNTPSGLKMTRREYPFPVMIGEKFYQIIEENQHDEEKQGEQDGNLRDIKLVVVFGGQMMKPRKFRGKFRIYIWPVVERSRGIWVRASYMSTVIFQECWNMLPRKKWELISMI